MRIHGIHVGTLAVLGIAGYFAMSYGIPAYFALIVFLGKWL